MPSYTRGVALDQLRFVKPLKGSLIAYGWKTKSFGSVTGITDKDITPLGHKLADALKGLVPVFRANRPKPARVKKIAARSNDPNIQLTVSTFCDADALPTALKSGWTLVKGSQSVGGGGGRARLAVVTTAGVKYAWSMNTKDFETYGKLIGAETTISAADRVNLVRGLSAPRPTRMKLLLSAKDTPDATFSTFVADSKVADLMAAGWGEESSAVPPLF
ncbi:MAG: hypothetical protein ACLFT0_12540 [Spirulinaceae cyanobacterium]